MNESYRSLLLNENDSITVSCETCGGLKALHKEGTCTLTQYTIYIKEEDKLKLELLTMMEK